MNGIAVAMDAGILLMLVLPGLAALLAKLRGGRAGRAGERAAEIEDVFQPGMRRQVEQMEIAEALRDDAESADGDPLHDFPDPEGLREQLDEGCGSTTRMAERRGSADDEEGAS